MLELVGVSKRFDATHAVASMNLRIPDGRTTVLIGPSGCGKSTLLRLMIGLIEPEEGHILFEGEKLDRATLGFQRQRMGYVIQDGGLFPHLTARENVALMARHLGIAGAEVTARVEELTEFTHFPAEALDRYPVQISGGQRQRVGLMRALMLNPDLLLLDEPLGALDPMIRAELQADLRRIFQALGKTVVLVTHDMGEASFLGDRIVLLREGRVVQQGSLDDLLQRPVDEFVSQFINAQRSPLDATSEAGSS